MKKPFDFKKKDTEIIEKDYWDDFDDDFDDDSDDDFDDVDVDLDDSSNDFEADEYEDIGRKRN